MAMYRVTIKETEVYVLEVEAESKCDALIQAGEILESSSDKFLYHNESDNEESAEEL